jgi:alkylation response protein AidB-like acyl-CoA dehydrogenase
MDFNHTEDRRMFAETVSKFVAENYDYLKRNEIAASSSGFDPQMWARFAEIGVIGALFDEAVGGYGGKGFDIAVIFEELGKAIVVEPFLANLLGGTMLAELGNEAHRGQIEDVIAGSHILGFAHTEPEAGYEPSLVSTTATKDGSNWLINGNKCVVISGDAADTIIVTARIKGDVNDENGISAFIIAPDAQGVSVRGYGTVDGYRAADITLENVSVAPDAMLGDAGGAFPAIEKALGMATLAVCAEALGAMQVSVMITNEFIKTRKQFGVPIGKFQALQHRMAEMMIELEQVRSGVINAAGNMESNRRDRQWYLSAAKNLVGRAGRLVAEESIQMHGGIGMTWEYSIAHFAKRLVMIDHLFGDEDHHLAQIVAMAR